MKNRAVRVCPYCRRTFPYRGMQNDHVPPRGLFGKAPGNINLVTVRCCSECHHGTSFGDEAFKAVLSTGIWQNEAATEIHNEVLASAEQNPWWLKSIREADIERTPITLPTGHEAIRFRLPKDVSKGYMLSLKRTVIGLLYKKWSWEWDWRNYGFVFFPINEENHEKFAPAAEALGPLRFHLEVGKGHFRAHWDFTPDMEMGVMILTFFDYRSWYCFLERKPAVKT